MEQYGSRYGSGGESLPMEALSVQVDLEQDAADPTRPTILEKRTKTVGG